MDKSDTLDGVPRSKSMTMLLEWSGAKVYMTRPALRDLAAELLRISEADPKECYEIHLSSFFSHWDANGEHIAPRTRFANGLAPVFDRIQKEFRSDDDELEWSDEPGFDVTIMHISPEAVREESERPDE